jgi:NAD(P)-dependent dehydrogenase (short-subunit alcohol dehydrogenase family)
VIGVARNSPANLPGVFIEADLADREKTQALADDLIARRGILGIVNNVGLAAIELAADDITANAVAPGPTETELFRSNNPQGSEGEARDLSTVLMPRFAHPSEVAAAIAFFASNAAAFISAQTLFVDGGASLETL